MAYGQQYKVIQPRKKIKNPLERIEDRLDDEREGKEKSENEIKQTLEASPEGIRLKNLLVSDPALLKKILHKFTLHNTPEINKENLEQALNAILLDPESCKQVGLSFCGNDANRLIVAIVEGVFPPAGDDSQKIAGQETATAGAPKQEEKDQIAPTETSKPQTPSGTEGEDADSQENGTPPNQDSVRIGSTKGETPSAQGPTADEAGDAVPSTNSQSGDKQQETTPAERKHEQLLELPEYPTLKLLSKSGLIPENGVSAIGEKMLIGKNIITAVDEYFDTIKDIGEGEKLEKKQNIKKVFQEMKEQDPKQNITNLKQDFQGEIAEQQPEKKTQDGGLTDHSLKADDEVPHSAESIPLLDDVGALYIKIAKTENPEADKAANLHRAVNTQANHMLTTVQGTIDKSTEKFKVIMNDLRNEKSDFKTLFASLKKLQDYISVSSAMHANQEIAYQKGVTERKNIQTKMSQSERMAEIQQLLAEAGNDAGKRVQYGKVMASIAEKLECLDLMSQEIIVTKAEAHLDELREKNASLEKYSEFLQQLGELTKENRQVV